MAAARHSKLLTKLERERDKYALIIAVCVTDEGRVVVVPSNASVNSKDATLVAIGATGVALAALTADRPKRQL